MESVNATTPVSWSIPKIKFYIEVRGEMKNRAAYDAAANKKVEAVRASLGV